MMGAVWRDARGMASTHFYPPPHCEKGSRPISESMVHVFHLKTTTSPRLDDALKQVA